MIQSCDTLGKLGQPVAPLRRVAPRVSPHLFNRSGIWYWRRRLPARAGRGTGPGSKSNFLRVSLRTRDRRTALYWALQFDAALERMLAVGPPPGGLTIAGFAALLRQHLLVEREHARAARSADVPSPVSAYAEAPLPQELAMRLEAFVQAKAKPETAADDAPGDGLPEELARDLLAALPAPDPKAKPAQPRAHGAAVARALAAKGRAAVLSRALIENDLSVAAEVVDRFAAHIGLAVPAGAEALLRRTALRVLTGVYQDEADRELGRYAVLPEQDPALMASLAPQPGLAVAEQLRPADAGQAGTENGLSGGLQGGEALSAEAGVKGATAAPLARMPVANLQMGMQSHEQACPPRPTPKPPAVVAQLPDAAQGLHSTKRPKPCASELIEPYLKKRAKVRKLRHHTLNQERGTLRRFIEVSGDLPIDEYERRHVAEFLEKLRQLPANYGKSPKDQHLSIAQLIERAERKDSPRLSDKTAKRHLSALSQFFLFAVDAGYLRRTEKADLVAEHSFCLADPRDGRDQWKPAELVKLFASPVWTGCHPYFRTQSGPQIIRDAKFWLPLLAFFHGGRPPPAARRRAPADADNVRLLTLTTPGCMGRLGAAAPRGVAMLYLFN